MCQCQITCDYCEILQLLAISFAKVLLIRFTIIKHLSVFQFFCPGNRMSQEPEIVSHWFLRHITLSLTVILNLTLTLTLTLTLCVIQKPKRAQKFISWRGCFLHPFYSFLISMPFLPFSVTFPSPLSGLLESRYGSREHCMLPNEVEAEPRPHGRYKPCTGHAPSENGVVNASVRY